MAGLDGQTSAPDFTFDMFNHVNTPFGYGNGDGTEAIP
jgi:hypothetical protein